jgi:hypothetical protein
MMNRFASQNERPLQLLVSHDDNLAGVVGRDMSEARDVG